MQADCLTSNLFSVIMEDNEKAFPDDELVTMFRGGDNHAFEILLARYTGDIMKSIRRSTVSCSESTDDLYQEVVVHVCEKLKNVYQTDGRVGAWLNCVVGNFLCSVYRKKSHECLPLKLDMLKDECTADNLLTAENKEQKFIDLKCAVGELPENLSELVRMKIWYGMTYQEISDRTGINRSTVAKRLKSAYQELEKKMLAMGYDDALI